MTAPLSFRAVSRTFGVERGSVRALAPLDLAVAAGETLVVFGRNGSGKTTLLRLASGRLEPSEGTVALAGVDATTATGRARARRDVALAGGGPAFYPDLSVHEHLTLVATAFAVPDPDDAIDALLADLALEDRADFLPDELSSGMRQKLDLAAALLRPADVLLLDEPTRALDARTRTALWERVVAARAGGAAVVLVSHHLDFPAALADRALVLSEGEVEALGPYAEVVASPAFRALGMDAA